jgi:hypothetical protein
MLGEELPFKVVRINSHDEVLARAANLLVGRAAYETAIRLFPQDAMQYRKWGADHFAEGCRLGKGERA